MTPSASTSNLTMLNRRARYIVALEQLGSSDPTVRMSGVYALVWLVDEWMNTDDAPAAQCRQEAQAAISSLCAYVRSPFSLASEYARFSSLEPAPFISEQEKQLFTVDKALFEAEAQVRAGIVEAIHSRTIVVDGKPGAWSGFQFDFTGSVFFYPVTFTGSCWGRPLSLRGCTYHASADFSRSVYYGDVDFSDSVFGGPTSFGYSVYRQAAKVHGCTFNGPVFFGVSHYHQGLDARTNLYNSDADFSGSVYRDDAYLHGCNYYGDANLSRCTYFGEAVLAGSTYMRDAAFQSSVYYGYASLSSRCREHADFSHCVYFSDMDMYDSQYRGYTDFTHCVYYGNANFGASSYEGTVSFSGSTYLGDVAMGQCRYEAGVDFSGSLYLGGPSREPAGMAGSSYGGAANFGQSIYCGTADIGESKFMAGAPSFDGCIFDPTVNNYFGNGPGGRYDIRLVGGFPAGARALSLSQAAQMGVHLRAIEALVASLYDVPPGTDAHRGVHQRVLEACTVFARRVRSL